MVISRICSPSCLIQREGVVSICWQLWPNHPPPCLFASFSPYPESSLNIKQGAEEESSDSMVVGVIIGGEHRGSYFRPFLPQDSNPWVSHRGLQKVLSEMHSKALPRALCPALQDQGITQEPQIGGPEGLGAPASGILLSVCGEFICGANPTSADFPAALLPPLIHSTNICRGPMTRHVRHFFRN